MKLFVFDSQWDDGVVWFVEHVPVRPGEESDNFTCQVDRRRVRSDLSRRQFMAHDREPHVAQLRKRGGMSISSLYFFAGSSGWVFVCLYISERTCGSVIGCTELCGMEVTLHVETSQNSRLSVRVKLISHGISLIQPVADSPFRSIMLSNASLAAPIHATHKVRSIAKASEMEVSSVMPFWFCDFSVSRFVCICQPTTFTAK